MSTGAGCYFLEKEPRGWSYFIQDLYVGGPDAEYDEYGPFPSFKAAYKHLNNNHPNPGGFSVEPHPDSDDKTWEHIIR